jgi:hypothetical protein
MALGIDTVLSPVSCSARTDPDDACPKANLELSNMCSIDFIAHIAQGERNHPLGE